MVFWSVTQITLISLTGLSPLACCLAQRSVDILLGLRLEKQTQPFFILLSCWVLAWMDQRLLILTAVECGFKVWGVGGVESQPASMRQYTLDRKHAPFTHTYEQCKRTTCMFLTVETLTGTLGGWKPRVVIVPAATSCRIFAEALLASPWKPKSQICWRSRLCLLLWRMWRSKESWNNLLLTSLALYCPCSTRLSASVGSLLGPDLLLSFDLFCYLQTASVT